MSQTTKPNLHKLTIRQREEAGGRASTGGNTQVFLDDQPLKGVTFLKLEFKAGRVTKILMEMIAEIGEIEGKYIELGTYFGEKSSENVQIKFEE
jgi:hypothetical protein